MKLERISAFKLKKLLETKSAKMLVLDCRPFLAFNNGRITGAANFFCPSILKRRFAAKGFLNLEAVLPVAIRTRLRNGEYTRLVIYDAVDIGSNHEFYKNSEVAIILQGLQLNSYSVKKTHILQGGFKRFRADFPEMCTGLRSSVEQSECVSAPFIEIPSRMAESEPTQLLPHLFIGDEQHSMNRNLLQRLEINAILNVSTTCSNLVHKDFTYKVIPVHDNVTENISSWFGEALQFIGKLELSMALYRKDMHPLRNLYAESTDAVSRNGGKILVHCRAGISRSATICIAYLMYNKSQTLEQAFEYVQSRRSIISPNLNFMQQLCEFERVLLLQMRDIIFQKVSTPLVCSKRMEHSPVMASGYFDFNARAISQT